MAESVRIGTADDSHTRGAQSRPDNADRLKSFIGNGFHCKIDPNGRRLIDRIPPSRFFGCGRLI